MISVLVNNHNYGRFIGEAIESVLSQDYADYELIIVDGISDDDSRVIIHKYTEKYTDIITTIYRNGSGQAAAINAGFAVCRGDVIALLDSDDCFLPGKLRRIAELHEVYSFVGTASKRSDGKDHDIPIDNSNNRQLLLRRFGFIYTYELTTSCISMRRDFAEQILPMPEDGYMTYADAYIKVMAQYYDNIYYCPERLSLYRIHEKNAMASSVDNKGMNAFLTTLYERVFRDANRKLLSENKAGIPDLSDAGYREAFDIANPEVEIHDGAKYAIYGIGLNSYRLLKLKEAYSIDFVLAIDSDPRKSGTIWEGMEVVTPDEGIRRREEYEKILIGATFYQSISQTLEGKGLRENKDFVGNLILNDF